jgi:hypothetical protein
MRTTPCSFSPNLDPNPKSWPGMFTKLGTSNLEERLGTARSGQLLVFTSQNHLTSDHRKIATFSCQKNRQLFVLMPETRRSQQISTEPLAQANKGDFQSTCCGPIGLLLPGCFGRHPLLLRNLDYLQHFVPGCWFAGPNLKLAGSLVNKHFDPRNNRGAAGASQLH